MQDKYSFIKTNKTLYETTPIPVVEGWEWHMYKHCKLTMLYSNSRYETGNQDDKPFNNIIIDKINLQHRAMNIDIKDLELYVDNPEKYYMSFMARKFHQRWARQKGLAKFLDSVVEVFNDYGGVLVRKDDANKKPEVVPFNKIAFVDQTDIVNNPICLRHYLTPLQMRANKKWNKEAVENVLLQVAKNQEKKTVGTDNRSVTSAGISAEVYELEGEFPKWWLEKNNISSEDPTANDYVRQLHIVAYYKDEKGEDIGVTLYENEAPENTFKFKERDEIFGRALGRGAVEELFEEQVWINHNEILVKEMLEQGSKIVYQTADKTFTERNDTTNIQQGQFLTYEDGKPASQLNTQPVNLPLFTNAIDRWHQNARNRAGANEAIAGQELKSGTPFRLGVMQNQELHSLHKYRKAKIADLIQEIYRDWVLQWLALDMKKKQKFSETLSTEEIEQVALNIATIEANKYIKEKIFNLQNVTEEEVARIREATIANFRMGGSKKFFEIMEGELDSLPLDVDVIITGQQRDNAIVAEKLASVFNQIAVNPAILQDAMMQKIFNEILETSGLSPLDFATLRNNKPKQVEMTTVEAPPQEQLQNNAVEGAPATN